MGVQVPPPVHNNKGSKTSSLCCYIPSEMGKGKIAFITSAHSPYDDRIYYHLADTLSSEYEVMIISSMEEIVINDRISIQSFDGNSLSKKEKVHSFVKYLKSFNPTIIIAAEPLPVIAAHQYKTSNNKHVRILYDVTEWYPSNRNIEYERGVNKIFVFVKMLLLNWYASFRCDGFIFGEYYKSLPYRAIFPFKKWKVISYYIDLKYIAYKEKITINNTLCLCYSGRISAEKGIDNFIAVVGVIKKLKPELKIKLKIIGWFYNKQDQNRYNEQLKRLEGVEIEFLGRKDFKDLSLSLQEADIFFDLREPTFENDYSLPIKLFYYAACGRPVMYSDIKAIRKSVSDINQFGFLVTPSDAEKIARLVIDYVSKPMLYKQHCLAARKLAEQKYNWQAIDTHLAPFVNSFH